MPGKTPRSNGNEPVENGIRNNQDADVKGKGKKGAKDADEEMTVVVKTRPVKGSGGADGDGDVAMDEDADEVKVDPVVQAVTGKLSARVTIQTSAAGDGDGS